MLLSHAALQLHLAVKVHVETIIYSSAYRRHFATGCLVCVRTCHGMLLAVIGNSWWHTGLHAFLRVPAGARRSASCGCLVPRTKETRTTNGRCGSWCPSQKFAPTTPGKRTGVPLRYSLAAKTVQSSASSSAVPLRHMRLFLCTPATTRWSLDTSQTAALHWPTWSMCAAKVGVAPPAPVAAVAFDWMEECAQTPSTGRHR